jgi:hypothetical protein
VELAGERPQPVAAGRQDEVVDVDPAELGRDRRPIGGRRVGEPLAEPPRRRVDADLPARLRVDERQLADVGQLRLARIGDLDREDVVAGREGCEMPSPVARPASVGNEDDEAAALRGRVRESQRPGGGRLADARLDGFDATGQKQAQGSGPARRGWQPPLA